MLFQYAIKNLRRNRHHMAWVNHVNLATIGNFPWHSMSDLDMIRKFGPNTDAVMLLGSPAADKRLTGIPKHDT